MILRTIGCMGIITVCLAAVSCKGKNGNMRTADPQEYKVVEIAPENKTLTASYSASIKGRQDVEIRPQVSGLITEILVSEGQKVNKGQTLFIIDQVAYRAALETARANVEIAQANVETAQLSVDSKEELYRQEVISLYDLQTSRNSLRSAKAQLAQTKAQEVNAANDLSYTVVKSPSNGIVGTLPYRVGALVNSSISTPLTTVSDNSEMYVYFSMTENHVLALIQQNGSLTEAVSTMPEVKLQLGDGTIYDTNGRVETISGVIEKTTGAVSVRAVFPNDRYILLSGGAGNIIFPYEMEQAIIIPQTATYEIQDRVFVYKVVDGKTQSAEIQVFGVNDGKTYVVESGLSVGDIIIAEGAGLMREGTAVIPVKQ